MKARSIVLTLAVAVVAASSSARAGEAKFSEDEQIGATFETLPISPRYPTPAGVGSIGAMPPASALTPIPPNVLNNPKNYALGEASVGGFFEEGDAKGRATHDRRVRRRHTAWTRHAYD